MKIFIGEFKIYDGERQHYKQLMIRANNQEEANEIFRSQEHDTVIKDSEDMEKITWFDYGDGMTIAEFRGSEEIPEQEALILEKHQAVHFFDEKMFEDRG